MIRLFKSCEPSPEVMEGLADGWRIPPGVVWLDLLNPTREEELAVEAALGFQIPTREEMAEIEASSRLYRHSDATFITADLLHHTDAPLPSVAPVTFILSAGPLVTVRYSEPRAFKVLGEKFDREPELCGGPLMVLMNLFEAVVDRTADVIERTSAEVESLSEDIFAAPGRTNYARAIKRLGEAQHACARIMDSLAGIDRALSFLRLDERYDGDEWAKEHMRSLDRDIQSLSGYVAGVVHAVNFQLNAALGLINIEQSGIIKIFSVAAVAFLPPTLIASIYGMNFDHMPELHWPLGYPMAILAMVISAVVPLLWFRKKGWL